MVMQKNRVLTSAAAFGAALSSLYAADVQADIVTITFTPSTVGPGNSLLTVLMTNTAFGLNADMLVDNSTSWGKNFYDNNNIVNIQQLSFSQSFGPGDLTNSGVVNFNYSDSGTRFIGFETAGGNVGWFNVDLGAPNGGTIVFLGSEYGSNGETLHVGGTAIPEPAGVAGLALLAMGALGVRRRKQDSQLAA